ncbi:hypothetical protein LINGRAHAP2_LOCUS14518, partial [Linum grandiflorum]
FTGQRQDLLCTSRNHYSQVTVPSGLTVHRQESLFTARNHFSWPGTIHQVLFTVRIYYSPHVLLFITHFFVVERFLLHNMEIQGVNENLLLCEDEDVNMDALDLQSDSTVQLEPYFKNAKPSPHLSHLDRYPFGGGALLFIDRESQGAAFFQHPKLKHQKLIGAWPLKDPEFNQWYARLCNDAVTTKLWRSAGISRLLSLTTKISEPDAPLFKAAMCFWCTGSYCFVFREPIRAMTITLMDLVAITGLSLPTINRRSTTFSDNQFIIELKTYLNLRRQHQPSNPTVPVTQQERVGFIHYWLYKFIHYPTTLGLSLGLSQLSHQIANGETPSEFAETILASLYY